MATEEKEAYKAWLILARPGISHAMLDPGEDR
jgi:hypothetical protein